MLPLILILLAAGLWFGRSGLAGLFSFAEDRTSGLEALRPDETSASSAARGHRAAAAFDGFNNRYWAPAVTGPGTGQYLEARFKEPVRLRKVLITSGRSVNDDEFLSQARPATLTVTLTDADGRHTTSTLRLRDQTKGQSFDVPGSDVVGVRLTVAADTYGVRPGRRVAVAEVEFFGHR